MTYTITDLKENETFKQVMSESFGGIMYDVANRGKYETAKILYIWDHMEPVDKANAGGIITGAINFIQEKAE